MAHEVLFEGDCYQVYEGQHGEDGHKHIVVDDGWVTIEGIGDHVTNEGDDEQSP